MCDFHSICVRVDGAIAHLPENSHSGAIAAAGWRENDTMADLRGKYFVEAEWDGNGQFPGVDKITRGLTNKKQHKVIEAHYTALAALLSDPEANGDRMLFDGGIFADDRYADIRWRVLVSENCPPRLAARLAVLPLYANGKPIKSLHPAVQDLSGNLVVAEGYEISAPALTKVGGNLDVSGSAKLDAPKLKRK